MRFKKNKDSKHGDHKLINNPMREEGRGLIRPTLSAGDFKNNNIGRRIDDFNRPSGYQPSQPNLNSQIFEKQHHQNPDQSLPSANEANRGRHRKHMNHDVSEKVPKKHNKVKIFKRTLVAVILLFVAGIILTISSGYLNLKNIFNSNNSLKTNLSLADLKKEGDGRINILVAGIGGPGHNGPDLTDTLILASIDPVNNKASLVSIPRDLWVNVPGFGQSKINAVYEKGKWQESGSQSNSNDNKSAIYAGFKLIDKTVSDVSGVEVKYNVLVDFQAFKQIVDTLGGININVTRELYDPTVAWENNNEPVIATSGNQTFNGTKALLFVRSRETTSDFDRSQRQRQAILAIKSKALSVGNISNPIKVNSVTKELGNNLTTNLGVQDILSLYPYFTKIGNNSISSVGLADYPNKYIKTANMNGQSIDEPSAGLYNYADLQYFMRNTLRDGYLARENATVELVNGSTNNTLMEHQAYILRSYGYNVTTSNSTPKQTYQKTTIIDLSKGKDKYTNKYLELRYKSKSSTSLPSDIMHVNLANFVIILGQDEISN